jgi:hypothetical protein
MNSNSETRSTDPLDPLATPGLLRFLLGPSASQSLADAGEWFTVQAYLSPRPEDGGRFILLALPCSKDVADAAARVALGTHRATRNSKQCRHSPAGMRPPTPPPLKESFPCQVRS